VAVTYYIFPHAGGWRVQSRGFEWDFAQGPQAVDFANDMAEQYARASGVATSVRFRDEAGEFHELRAYEAALPWLPEPRDATLLPFRRKGH